MVFGVPGILFPIYTFSTQGTSSHPHFENIYNTDRRKIWEPALPIQCQQRLVGSLNHLCSQPIRDTSGQMNCITFLIGFDSLSAPLPSCCYCYSHHYPISTSARLHTPSSFPVPLPLSHDPPIHSHPVSNMFLTLMPKRLCNTATKTLGGGREYIALLANLYFLFVLPVFILNNSDDKACHTTPTGANTS